MFICCYGGWDTTRIFTPAFDISRVSVESDASTGMIGGIPFVDHVGRPSVSDFFSRFSNQTCVVNGMEIGSVAHNRCRDILLTGSDDNHDDWASIIASDATGLAMPHLVITGPVFNRRVSGHVARVGLEGPLPDLLSGEVVTGADGAHRVMPPSVGALQDAWLRGRLSDQGDDFSQRSTLKQDAGELNLKDDGVECARDLGRDGEIALEAFTRGLSRCAMIQHDGLCDFGWDT